MACGPHKVTGTLNTLTCRMPEAEPDTGLIRPNHLKYELSLSSDNDQEILSTNMHRCSGDTELSQASHIMMKSELLN